MIFYVHLDTPLENHWSFEERCLYWGNIAPNNIYTRKNLDPNPNLEQVEDLEKLPRKMKIQVDAGIPLINRSISFPKEGVITFEYFEFDEKFELSLFISKSYSYLNQKVLI